MSHEPANETTTAADVIGENTALDHAILDREYPPALIHLQPGARDDDPDPWTIAEQLCHVAEFQNFFDRQLRAWLEDPGVEMGRTHDHDERLAAIEAATGREPADLLADVRAAATALAATLARLDDVHLGTMTNNVKYGAEPLAAFLDRYVIGHKRAHVRQLTETLNAVTATIRWASGTTTPGVP